MNLGWIRRSSSETDIQRLVLHEVGHALGSFHEHKPRKTPLVYIADSQAFDDYYLLEKGMRVPGINPQAFLVNKEAGGRLMPKFTRGQTQYSRYDCKYIMVYDLTKPPLPFEEANRRSFTFRQVLL